MLRATLLLLAAAAGTTFVLLSRGTDPSASVSSRTKTVQNARWAQAKRGVIERTVRVSGATASIRTVYLVAPRVRGSRRDRGASDFSLVLSHLLPAGSRVRAGDIVAEFDRQYMQQRVDDLKSSLIQQQASLEKLRANLELKRTQQEQRLRTVKGQMDKAALDLKTAPVRSQIQVERFQMNLGEAQAAYEEIRKQTPLVMESERAALRRYEMELEETQFELDRAERNRDRMVFKAPIDGVVVLGRVYRGGEYTDTRTGDSIGSGNTFAEIQDDRNLVVDALVNQVDVEQIRLGQAARIRVDAFSDVAVPGKVVSISAAVRSGRRPQFVSWVPIRISMALSDPRLTPRLSANADIVVDANLDAVVIPRAAVHEDEGRPCAFVQTETGWEKRSLELGLANHVEVAVERGVSEGEWVSLAALEAPTAAQ